MFKKILVPHAGIPVAFDVNFSPFDPCPNISLGSINLPLGIGNVGLDSINPDCTFNAADGGLTVTTSRTSIDLPAIQVGAGLAIPTIPGI